MPDHDFLFALDLSDEAHFDAMLGDLAGSVLAYVGYTPAAVDELRGELRGALQAGQSNGNRQCDVRFTAKGGELLITVAYRGAGQWQTRRALP